MKTDDISNLRRIVSDWRNSRYQINERIAISELLDHADEQAKQIATVKAICIKERFWQIWKAGECQTVERATQKAKDQLAKEYPEINWDE